MLTLVGLAGCGSYWDIPKDKTLEYGCTGALNWYPDCDRDGFGEYREEPIVVECDGNLTKSDEDNSGCQDVGGDDPNQRPLLASNRKDCDLLDDQITANVGICPQQIGAGEVFNPYTGEWESDPAPSACFDGLQSQSREFVATCGESPMLSSQQAVTSCVKWGGELEGHKGLARITDAPEGLLELLAGLEAGGVRSLWIDVSYDAVNDEWNYEGDGTVPLAFEKCETENPTLADFWPEINPNLVTADSDGDEVPDRIERQVGTDPGDASSVDPTARGTERLALVKRDGEDWCWGAPGRYGLPPREAYPLCERPQPDPTDFEEKGDAAQ